jgi:hypothetical protein
VLVKVGDFLVCPLQLLVLFITLNFTPFAYQWPRNSTEKPLSVHCNTYRRSGLMHALLSISQQSRSCECEYRMERKR